METRTSQRIEPMQKCSYGDSSDAKSHANNKSCKVISKLLLPEDLMIDIFTLVPLTCLFNSARYVCKSWYATICSSHFAEACKRPGSSKPGLYVENRTAHVNSYFLEFKDDVNGQFERTDLGTHRRMGRVISTCDGILLLSEGPSSLIRKTFVANPILKCWFRIPPFPSSNLQHLVFEFQLIIARVPLTAVFKLFHANILEISGALWYVLYALRIGIDNSWKEIARKESPRWEIFLQFCIGGNDIYWIANKEVIVIDVDIEVILREYPLPHLPNYPAPNYLLMGNRLSCIASKGFSNDLSNTTYQIYILDFHSGKWSIYHEMGPFDYVAACVHEHFITDVVFRFWIDDQIIFRVTLNKSIFTHKKKIHFGYNVKTKQLTKIEDIDVGDFEVWLHTNSLVTLPSSPA
jgi:hypothetical protein